VQSAGPALLLPAIIGHRGAAAVAPANTLAGLRIAAAAGAHWVEIDVRLSADGVPVLAHDDTLRKMARDDRAVSSLTAEELGRIAVPGPFRGSFPGETVPTLAAALALGRELRIGVNVEIKAGKSGNRTLVEKTLDAIADARSSGGPTVLLSSFRHAVLAEARRLAPDLPIGMLMGTPREGWRDRARELAAAVLICSARRAGPLDIKSLVATGLPVACYTVNNPADARALFSQGVASVFTDDPAGMIAALK